MPKIDAALIGGLALIASLAGCGHYAPPFATQSEPTHHQSDDTEQPHHVPPASATAKPKQYHAPGAVTTLTRAPDGSVIEVITNIPHKGTQP